MFGPRIGWRALAVTCDSLAKLLDAGVPILRSVNQTARKSSDPRCRRAMADVATRISDGEQIIDAMRAQGGAFPPLMLDLVAVAEATGTLPEMFEHLRDHYENNLRLRRTFIGQIAWPVFQFVVAVFVVALLILLMGWIAESRGNEPIDVLGLGLFGTGGAILWLSLVFGTVLVLFTVYQVLVRVFSGRAWLHGLVLRIPVLGNCARSFALARFSWAFYLTQQTGMSIDESLEASLRATNNGAFAEAAPRVIADVRAGSELTPALAATGLFPTDFIEMVSVGETTGTIPETLDRLSPRFEEAARRSLSALTTTLGWIVWAIVAGFIVFFIFRIASWYVGLINSLV